MKSIGVVTVARSDFGILLPVLRLIQDAPDLELRLFVAAAHLAPTFGQTVDQIEELGFPIAERIEMRIDSDSPAGMAMTMGLGTLSFGQAFARNRPDLLFVIGDRAEMHAAAVAAIPFRIPIAHLHGGDITEGAIDDVLRHAITKYAHLHFCGSVNSAERVRQMGEEDWRVTVSGGPSIDNLLNVPKLSRAELSERLGLDLAVPTLMVCYHPVTLEHTETEPHVKNLLEALRQLEMQVVLTAPNADTGSASIRRLFLEFAQQYERGCFQENLGPQGWPSLMQYAKALVGNSSSGICEAASFALPVVNIGNRQRGREHGENVIHCDERVESIVSAIRRAVSHEFRDLISGMSNPYGDGNSAERIVARLREIPFDDRLIAKRFVKLTAAEEHLKGVK